MQALEAILTRVTVPPVKMNGPGPDDAALGRMLEAAAAAPDHGKLQPWRFLVVKGDGRAALGELFARSLAAERPETSPGELEKQRAAPLRAPLIIVAITRLDPGHPKIPAWEQEASAACAVHNLLLAAHAMGFAGKWAIGRAVDAPPAPARPAPEAIARAWP
jgi:nitroreductase